MTKNISKHRKALQLFTPEYLESVRGLSTAETIEFVEDFRELMAAIAEIPLANSSNPSIPESNTKSPYNTPSEEVSAGRVPGCDK